MVNEQTTNQQVEHNSAAHRFEIELGDDQYAYVRYRYLKNQSAVDLFSTYVPDSHRGQGLAGLVVDAAFAWAESEKLEILTSCWYAEKRRQSSN